MTQDIVQKEITVYTRRWLYTIQKYFGHPLYWIADYDRSKFQPDLVASITIAIMLLPQAIAYALIAELPAAVGLFAAIIAAIIGGLWGSSHHLHTGPTNTTSLIVLSGLLAVATPGTPEYLLAAGVMAFWAGFIRLIMGVARLGILVNFVSDAVVVGFTGGAGILIVVNQIRHIMRIEGVSSAAFFATTANLFNRFTETHLISLQLGIGCIVLLIVLKRFAPKLPAPLIVLMGGSLLVWLFGLNDVGVATLGELPRGLPPLKSIPIFNIGLIREMGPSILAVGMIGLIEAASISRAVAARSGQYLNSDQEFVGQGLANMAVGFFSGYPVAGSLTRSVVNYEAGARSQMSSILSGLWVLLAMLLLAPAAAYLPRAALAAILIVTGVRMLNYREARRIFRSSRGDSAVMALTFLATLLLSLEDAVLTGVLASFAFFIMKTSTPTVREVLPTDDFKHFFYQPEKPGCPQLAVLSILGGLYFGAAPHVEDAIRSYMDANPDKKYLLLRMQRVNHLDISGIHMLETIVRLYRQRDGDVFIVGLRQRVEEKMKLSGFDHFLGQDHFLDTDQAIPYIFNNFLSPAVCVYDCPFRVWKECQALPKSNVEVTLPDGFDVGHLQAVPSIAPADFWLRLNSPSDQEEMEIIDIREPAEFEQGHLRVAKSVPMSEFFNGKSAELPRDRDVIFICRSGRRSQQLAHYLINKGFDNVHNLAGGMVALELAALPKAGENR